MSNDAQNNQDTADVPNPPFLDIKPPVNMQESWKQAVRTRNVGHILFGFPLTDQYSMYHYEQVRVHDPKVIEHILFHTETEKMRRTCRKIWPGSKPRMSFAFCDPSTYDGDDFIPFLSLGHSKPPPDILEQLKEAMAGYGVLEKPDYYPKVPGY